ncbi:MAG TPA: transporter substrate-binding domain-containing protein [Alphaproteobacteria bacterium]|nr:transporter substrate-binding domain-containing protein [Alphaproteobacteria bacterium]
MKLGHIIVIALLGALMALAGFAAAKKSGFDAAPTAEQPAFAHVMETHMLHCVQSAAPPAPALDPYRDMRSAVAYDIMQRVGAILGLKIIWNDDIPLAGAAAYLKEGRGDVLCSLIRPLGPRAAAFDYLRPVDYIPVAAYARADDARFDGDLGHINHAAVTIAVIDGRESKAIADADFPNATQYVVTGQADGLHMLLAVTTKKADVAFADSFTAGDFIKDNPGTLKPVAGVGPLRVYGESFAVAPGESRLRDMLNVALDQLEQNGFIRATLDKYFAAHKGEYFYAAKEWE